MAGCLLRDRDLRTKQKNMSSKTWVSTGKAPSHRPQEETNKEVPRVAARLANHLGHQTSYGVGAQLRSSMSHQSAAQILD